MRSAGGGDAHTASAAALDGDALDREAMRRMVAVVNTALREHLIGLQSEGAVKRLTGLLAALGFDARQQWLAVRAAQLLIGTSCPGEPAVMMFADLPADSPQAAWERAFIDGVRGVIT